MAGYARPPGNLAVEIGIFTESMSRLLRDSGNSFFRAQLILSIPETRMLSPHEFATLMLVKDASDSIELDRAELDALLERQLVAPEKLASGGQRFRITFDGDSILQAVARIR